MESEKDSSKEALPRSELLDAKAGFTWVQWPRYFDTLYLKYQFPSSLMDTIRFLWSACFGVEFPCGTISLVQIPVEGRAVRKWIAALMAAGIFTYERAAVLGDQEGSEYRFHETSPAKWEFFFAAAAWVVSQGGLEKDVSTEEFGNLFTCLSREPKRRRVEPFTLRDGTPGDHVVMVPESSSELYEVVATEWRAMLLRKKKKGGPKPTKAAKANRG